VKLGKGLLVPAVVAAALSLPPAAQADPMPPVLTSVGHSGGYLTAGWTLGPGTEADFIEAATSPETYPEGNFLAENTPLVDFLDPGQTAYASPIKLEPGLYFVHVAAYDPLCPVSPCLDVFTETVRVTVEPAPPPTQSGPTSAAPPPDRTTGFAMLAVASRQRAGALAVEFAMPEAGTVTVSGTIDLPNAAKAHKLKAVAVKVVPGKTLRVKVKLPKRTLVAVTNALRRRKKVKANLTITARDAAGNTKTEKRSVKLRR
jgi:hypothetical protein